MYVNGPFGQLQEFILNGSPFCHTNIDNAAGRLTRRLESNPKQITVSIIGGDDIRMVRNVCRNLIQLLSALGIKDDIIVIHSNRNICDKIVRQFAERSGIETLVVEESLEENWKSESSEFQRCVDDMIALSDVVIMLEGGRWTRELEYAYRTAIVEGCFVARRIVR